MNTEKVKVRIDELIGLADNVLSTKRGDGGYMVANPTVSYELFSEFRSSSLSFIEKIFGTNHVFYLDFERKVKTADPFSTEDGRGILKAVRQEIYGGWLFSLKGLVSAEIFSDFLQMAEYLLEEGYKDPSAVLIGSVLEEHLRHLCSNNGIELVVKKGEKTVPKKADLMNVELAKKGAYNSLDQKSALSWLAIRNSAAHGKYSEYSTEQVKLMYDGVVNFISKTSL